MTTTTERTTSMADQTPRVLTHHVNIRNPETKEVQTFEPQDGVNLPAWAHDALMSDRRGEPHQAYPKTSSRGVALVRQWQASKLAAEAALMAQEG